jgi:hypothetical protein
VPVVTRCGRRETGSARGQWRDFQDALAPATKRPAVAYDRLGFGRSTQRLERPPVSFVADEAVIFSSTTARTWYYAVRAIRAQCSYDFRYS